jgi:glycerol-3-phosphate acyltransferase PlsX
VGVLNIGTEETKGNQLVQDAYKLLKAREDVNFIGFIEGRDYPMGKVDVVVTDGFTGNVSLKTAEGIAKMMNHMLRQELLSSPRGKLGGAIAKPAFQALKKRVDHDEFGGALLVGLKGVCVIAHGGSRHTAVKNAIRVACNMVKSDVVARIEQSFSVLAATAQK